MQPKRIILPLALLLLLSALLFLPTEQRLGLDFVQTMEPSEDAVFVTPEQNPARDDKKNVVLNQTSTFLPRKSSWESLAQALNKGQPITILNPNGNSETYWMRPRLAVSEDFQVTIGKARDNKLHVKPMVYEGYHFPEHPSGNPSTITSGIRAFFTIVGNSFAAVINDPKGNIREITMDPQTGLLEQRLWPMPKVPYSCRMDPRKRIAAVSTADSAILTQHNPPETVEIIPPVLAQGGEDPATGSYSKIIDTIIGGQSYEASLKDALMLVVMDKEATGIDAIENLTGKASLQLCRMANISSIYENQIGTRILVQELIMTPKTDEYDDIPASLGDFRTWAENQRPRNQFPRTLGTKVGNGLSGSTLGLGYVGVLKGGHSYSIVRPGYDHALLSHEMGHNFGSGHSSGGIMNSSWKRGERDFFKKVNEGETSAKKMYNHSKSRLNGPATLRHPEEIPFAKNDSAQTIKGQAVTLEPMDNDKTFVLNGKENRLRIAELGPVFPIGAGTASVSGGEVTFIPSNDYTGHAWFSYSLQGDVGNSGDGWLHKGDIAIKVQSSPGNLKLTLRPGDSHIHYPTGSGDLTVKSQPQKARADRTGDDKKAIIIRVNANATGTDSFVYRKNNTDQTVEITYLEAGPQTRSDIFVYDTTQEEFRFNPLLNDEIPGTRSAQQIRPVLGVGTNGKGATGTLLYPNGFQLISSTLLDPDKGTLTEETSPYFVDGEKVNVKNGFLKFEPKGDAKGLAKIEYVVADAAGNQKKESVVILLPLVTITSPSIETAIIHQNSGLILEGTTHASSEPPLSGTLSTRWSMISSPKNSVVTFDDANNKTTGASFSLPGTYILRLTASDEGGYGTFDEITIKVDLANDIDDPADQPVAWWKLDENSGMETADASGNEFSAILAGPIWKQGIQGRSLEFDGKDDYVDLLPPLIASGSNWKYLDTGQSPGTSWENTDFDDSSWKTGPSELGYGDNDENTTLLYGENTNKFPSYYFRKTFSLQEGAQPQSAKLLFKRDDAIAIYLDGEEIYRDVNLPKNATYQSYATATISNENEWKTVAPPQALLSAGTHTICAEVHQSSGTSSDLSFDLTLELEPSSKPTDKILKLSQGSVSLWIKTGSTSNMTLLSAADTNDPDREWKIYLNNGKVHYQVTGDRGTETEALLANKTLSDDRWHHVALKVDPATNAVFYIDGKWTAMESRPFLSVVQNIDVLQLGRSLTSDGATNHFKGEIDDVRIYSRPLLGKEIESLSYATSNRGPVIQLPDNLVRVPFNPFDMEMISPMVEDDDRPSSVVDYQWSLLSGTGTLGFDNAKKLKPKVFFDKKGAFRLRLIVDDSQIKTFRDLEIEYIDGGDQKPISLGIPNLSLNENADAQSIDLYSAFEDMQDPDKNMSYMIAGNTNPGLFESIQIKGTPSMLELTLKPSAQGMANITIRATDTDNNSVEASFKVTLRNQPPEILEQTLYIQENSPVGTIVGTIQASDPDGDTPHFQIVSGNEQGLFILNPTTGQITIGSEVGLDYETIPSRILFVAATDTRNPSVDNNAEIRVYLVNENEAPVIGDSTFEITESVKAGDILGPISGSDPEDDTLTIDITEGNDDGLFTIDGNGFLAIAKDATLDALQAPRRTLTVRAKDTGFPPLGSNGTVRINILRQIFAKDSNLRYLVPSDNSVDTDWMKVDFNDAGWTNGKLAIGYDTGNDYDTLLGTDLEAAMRGKSTSAYARIPFQVSDPGAIGNLKLKYLYDDGCIVYLNGQKVLEINAPQNPSWNSAATNGHEAADLQTFDELNLTPQLETLVIGTNVLAVHLLNDKNTSSDLIFEGRLTTSSAGTPVAPNPAEVEVTGSGIAGRTTSNPTGQISRTNGEQPRVTLVLDEMDQGKSVTAWTRQVPLEEFTGDTFSMPVDNLQPGTTYFYAFYATNSGGISWTETANTFTTRANQPPSALIEEYKATEGVILSVAADQGLLANDTDPEKDPLTANVLTKPSGGTLELAVDGSFTYTPNQGFSGTDSFTYITADPYDNAISTHTWISRSDEWKYRDESAAPDPKWQTPGFNDSSWKSGPAELGYGDNDEKTNLDYGDDAKNKTPSYYFRKTFSLPEGAQPLSANILFKRDDAAALYINGAEFHRDNNLAKVAGHNDYANGNVQNENTYVQANLDPALLLAGNNLLAAEVHQGNATSSDLSFDLELTGTLRAETIVTIIVEPGDPGNADTDADGLPDTWEQTHFGAKNAEPDDDPDVDGLVNLVEYALGTDPANLARTAGTNAEEPSISIVEDVNQSYIEITFRRRKGTQTAGDLPSGYTVDGITYTLQVSADLKSWQTGPTLIEDSGIPIDNGDGTETVKARLKKPISTSQFQFLQLQISVNK
ncbi:MAG: cadherin-like domain-containing protein [Opitutae bacterium]|nr:cadherin-like domain-containing protein [Opitutae bacterium]